MQEKIWNQKYSAGHNKERNFLLTRAEVSRDANGDRVHFPTHTSSRQSSCRCLSACMSHCLSIIMFIDNDDSNCNNNQTTPKTQTQDAELHETVWRLFHVMMVSIKNVMDTDRIISLQ